MSLKFFQIGADAYNAILKSVTTGADLTKIGALLVLDLHGKVADGLIGFLKFRQSSNCSAFLIALYEDNNELQCAETRAVDFLVEKYKAGDYMVNGQKISTDLPSHLSSPLPDQPKLNKLVIKDNKLLVPPSLVQEWQGHSLFGQEFTSWLDAFLAEKNHDFVKADDVVPKTPDTKNKRKGEESGAADPVEEEIENSSKKAKLNPVTQIENEKIAEPLLHEAPLEQTNKSKNGLWMQVRANHAIWIVNKD